MTACKQSCRPRVFVSHKQAKRPDIAGGEGHDMEPGHKHPQLMLTAADKTTVSISPVGVPSAQGVIINYVTDPGNQPKTFSNHIYVWQTTENTVPWDKSPEGDQPIDTDSSASTQFVTFDFEDK